MKLYGSVVNRLAEHTLSPEPVVGMGLTVYMWSDRYAGTITKVSPSGKTVWFTRDTETGWRDYSAVGFAPRPDGAVEIARKGKNGAWRSAGNGVRLGSRSAYRDPSF